MLLKQQCLHDSELQPTLKRRRFEGSSTESTTLEKPNCDLPKNYPSNSVTANVIRDDSDDLLDRICSPGSNLNLAGSSPTYLDSCDNVHANDTADGNNELMHVKSSFKDKIHALLISHMSHVTKEFTSDLLQILREDGHTELPTSAASLLRSNLYRDKEIKQMQAKSNRKDDVYGYYVYFGIAENLKRIISPNIYKNRTIKLLINVDGLPIFNRSNEQLWPILMLVFDVEYESSPFIVGAFCGKSKPKNIAEFLEDFIYEIKDLVKNGIDIDEEHFVVEILGFVCDTPARAFLKCCKGHGGFYACERCEIRGISVANHRGNKKRIYANINAQLRTKRSFEEQNQERHHVGRSPLLDIPGFDPVSGFFPRLHALALHRSDEDVIGGVDFRE